jgi:hypothetical protein
MIVGSTPAAGAEKNVYEIVYVIVGSFINKESFWSVHL